MTVTAGPGLENIIATQTRLSDVQGSKGELTIAGFPAEVIAPRASFEEVCFLLWRDRLPSPTELEEFRYELASQRSLPNATLELLRQAATQKASSMDAMRVAVASLDLDKEMSAERHAGPNVVARVPTIAAAYHRLSAGMSPVAPSADLGHAANYLYMLTGELPTPAATRAIETYLNTVIDHGLNASTFAARVIIATQSDMVSAVTGAIGALKGPLHGGAPGPALDMVFEIGVPERAEPHLRALLDRGERLMGFGHRVYKVRDPRADILAEAARSLYESGSGDEDLYRLATEVEQIALRLLDEYKPGRNLQTNVEYYTALLLHSLGFPTSLFTPTFAVGRVVGWVAHCLEQLETGRLIRPGSEYTGQRNRTWVPAESR